jgi:hypothetical protein
MYPQWHLMAGLTVGVASLLFSQSIPFFSFEVFGFELSVFALCIGISVLMDVDHLFDLWLYWKRSRRGKLRDWQVFHSVENAVILTFLSIFFPFLVFPVIGYICHIAMDVLGNNNPWQFYFYAFRFGRKWVKNPRSPKAGI